MGPVALAGALITLTSKIMDKLPDYDQRKKEHFLELQEKLTAEMKRQYPDRDDDLIMNIRDELTDFCMVFSKELK